MPQNHPGVRTPLLRATLSQRRLSSIVKRFPFRDEGEGACGWGYLAAMPYRCFRTFRARRCDSAGDRVPPAPGAWVVLVPRPAPLRGCSAAGSGCEPGMEAGSGASNGPSEAFEFLHRGHKWLRRTLRQQASESGELSSRSDKATSSHLLWLRFNTRSLQPSAQCPQRRPSGAWRLPAAALGWRQCLPVPVCRGFI